MDVNINKLLYQEHTPQINLYLAYCFLVMVLVGTVYSKYLDVFDFIDYAAILVPTFIYLLTFQLATRSTIAVKAYIAHAIVGLSWAFAFSLLENTADTFWNTFKMFTADYILGLSLFTILTLSHLLLVENTVHTKIITLVYTLIDFLLMIPVIMQIIYYGIKGYGINANTLNTLEHSKLSDIIAYLPNHLGSTQLILLSISLLIIIYLFYLANNEMKLKKNKGHKYKYLTIGIYLCGMLAFIQHTALWRLLI